MQKSTIQPTNIALVVRAYWLTTFASASIGALFLWIILRVDILIAWLASINLVALLAYGYDKSIAGSGRTRVPERLLLSLAYTGGSLGALIGMRIFHHKTAKTSFQVRFWIILIIQVGLLLFYLFVIKPMAFSYVAVMIL